MIMTAVKQYYRRIDKDTTDFHPTPPWATRALFHHVLGNFTYTNHTCLEPACGNGHMSEVLTNHFKYVFSVDIEPRDYFPAGLGDYLNEPIAHEVDWIITNPPFSQAEAFIQKAVKEATVGVAMLCRLQLLEGKGRFERLWIKTPPTLVAPFVERVSMVKNKVVRKSGSTMAMAWFVWYKTFEVSDTGDAIYRHELGNRKPFIQWIPPCQKELEKDSDYD